MQKFEVKIVKIYEVEIVIDNDSTGKRQDPEGMDILGALRKKEGYQNLQHVSTGKFYRVSVKAETRNLALEFAKKLCIDAGICDFKKDWYRIKVTGTYIPLSEI